MNQYYITKVKIDKVRHLENIEIPLSETECRHLILTGKNGSGKTSIVKTLSDYLSPYCKNRILKDISKPLDQPENLSVQLSFNNLNEMYSEIQKGEFIISYYEDERKFLEKNETSIKKVSFKNRYKLKDKPSKDFIHYLLELKTKSAMAKDKGKIERANEIDEWFQRFDSILQMIFSDDRVKLDFDFETFEFHIDEPGKDLFSFDQLSSGYAAILDIVIDLMMRMEQKCKGQYNLPGIVIIDEIETHLHLKLQKQILPILTRLFPNIQFIVTTHSPFVLNSLPNVVIYDLENHTLVNQDVGLSNVPYEGVVEGYFNVSMLSNELKEKFERYKQIIAKDSLTDRDYGEILTLQLYLDKIPDYLALGIMSEYRQLKLKLTNRVNEEAGEENIGKV